MYNLIFFWSWAFFTALTLYIGVTDPQRMDVSWSEYPAYLKEHPKHITPILAILSWLVMWVELAVRY